MIHYAFTINLEKSPHGKTPTSLEHKCVSPIAFHSYGIMEKWYHQSRSQIDTHFLRYIPFNKQSSFAVLEEVDRVLVFSQSFLGMGCFWTGFWFCFDSHILTQDPSRVVREGLRSILDPLNKGNCPYIETNCWVLVLPINVYYCILDPIGQCASGKASPYFFVLDVVCTEPPLPSLSGRATETFTCPMVIWTVRCWSADIDIDIQSRNGHTDR